MLEILTIMNSPVEDVFNFKTCCGLRVFDQNLEIHIVNHGHRPIEAPSYFDLQGKFGSCRVDTLIPSGVRKILPGETLAFYCTMDEGLWCTSERIVFYDQEGHEYLAKLNNDGG